uniref:Uncharacterized protein n=1 Tax=Steinernema glaseri TaxID=37863 RepID=A0A1I7ZL30_9BILA
MQHNEGKKCSTSSRRNTEEAPHSSQGRSRLVNRSPLKWFNRSVQFTNRNADRKWEATPKLAVATAGGGPALFPLPFVGFGRPTSTAYITRSGDGECSENKCKQPNDSVFLSLSSISRSLRPYVPLSASLSVRPSVSSVVGR